MTERIHIETERLILREITGTDAEAMFALNADPDVVRYTGDGPFASLDDAKALFEGYGEVYGRTGMGRLALVTRDDGLVVGFCGLKRQDDGEVDLGYRLVRRLWGRGIATEASRACLADGFERLKLDRIVARAHVDNVASVRVMQKLAMRFVGPSDFDGAPGVLYELRPP